jgi:hypothetical protein
MRITAISLRRGACAREAIRGHLTRTTVVACVALVALVVLGTARAAETQTSGPVPRLAEFRVKSYRSGYQELIIRFAGQLRGCEFVNRPAKIKLVFKGNGASWRSSNTWCMDPCDCALGQGTWGAGAGFLFENMDDALAARRLTLVPTEAFGGVSVHRTFNLGYWVSVNGSLLRFGRLQVRIDKDYRTIWQGTDDFINVCINDLEKLYSSGGRLYCLSLEFDYSMKLVR